MTRLVLGVVAICACGRSERRAWWVEPQTIAFDAKFLATPQGTTLPLPLTSRLPIAATRTRIAPRGHGDFTWFGTTPAGGRVILASAGGSVYGTAIDHTTTYRLVSIGPGRLQIVRVDHKRLPPVHPPGWRPKVGALRASTATFDAPIEVLVLYTDGAAKAEQACPNIEALAQAAVDQVTEISSNSKQPIEFHTAGVERTGLSDDADIEDVLATLAADGDTRTLRDAYHADLVVMLVHKENSSYQGMSTGENVEEDGAFAVVDCSVAAANYALAHEIGHLMGLQHDIKDEPWSGAFPDGRGFVHDASDIDHSFYTVMGNPGSCTHDCRRIMHWSNPLVQYGPDDTGVPDQANSARVLGVRAAPVSKFRDGHPPAPPP